MLNYLLIAAFGAIAVLGQTSYGSEPEPFKYWGCATVDAAGFSEPVQFPSGVLSHESCQAACAGHIFAAVSPDACRCGNDPDAIHAVDEGSCNHPCFENPDSPMCGGICPEGKPRISTLFIIDTVFLQDEVLPERVNPENPAVPANNTPVPPLMEQSAASSALAEEVSETEISPPEIGVSQVLPPPTDAPLPPPETSAPAPPSASTPGESLPSTSVSEPESTIPVPPTILLSTSTSPQENPPATSASDISSSTLATDIPPDSSVESVTSETLLTETLPEPIPSITPNRNDGPVPSQVLVSESSQFEVPVLTALGELLLIAVMIA
ncbi:WSC domain-containing protein [Fusarium keratoplasticum]|uniref:WSC domain-containing protein n=1 Tax=Fusarium keratoplasticum TaxID=1328300 RepID=A0ACC0R2T9_9HYPO|nr:WSC domain-containing protein [Fusarium keratoplasticum]KAI8671714.1 WSC domain-containing protein [Fusarium keratoplasticum]